LTWAVGEAKKDAKWMFGAVRRGAGDPVAAVCFIGEGLYMMIVYIFMMLFGAFGLKAKASRD